jgi:Uma2 family endonuclease
MAAAPPRRLATVADLLALGEDARAELIDGEIAEKAAPTFEHGVAQGTVIGRLHGPYHRRPGGGQPGGWWLVPEVDVELSVHQVFRPDVSGWRRERVPEPPRERPVKVRPDWVCEVLSTTNAGNDLVKKLRAYHQAHVDHDWIVDPEHATLTVLRWAPEGYVVALTGARADRVRAEPFEAVELPVGALFGDEDEP